MMNSLITFFFTVALIAVAVSANTDSYPISKSDEPNAVAPIGADSKPANAINFVSRAEDCCYTDACTGVRTCVPANTFFTDGCGRTYNVSSSCKLTRKRCCYSDACNSERICREAITVFTDSCGNSYVVQANCNLKRV
ncbi:unnamed protein product [Agarophyton chilense]|eukprot:gb/GEZJ01007951.1/.p1 GENE.gb/GEZJ01007951.1/~~gb/GEZJ01007951.1/.p1  ORF type:complete len:138 (+),score=9.89 gb/GEZJ01007951.1/:1376-1789(+)